MSGSVTQRSLRRRLFSTVTLSAVTIVALLVWLLLYYDGYASLREHVRPLNPAFDQGKGQNYDQDQDQTQEENAYQSLSSPALAVVSTPVSFALHDSASTSTMPVMNIPTETPSRYAPDASSGEAPPVKLPQGTYKGIVLPAGRRLPKAIEAWRGIPFAESTAGPNRFRPPVPVGPSEASFSAARFGAVCPGAGVAEDEDAAAVGLAEGEDCLNLNVYRPQAPVEHMKLPVVIYVHGGGFNSGLGVERDLASFVSWAEDSMVGVNFNYRIGALGFLPSALMAKEGLLNLGLKDQQLLLQWVQENIAAFGGDPENVTLMGLSAGAHSIGHHLMSYTPETAPFKRAILESGAPTARSIWWPTHPRHLIQFREFLVAAGVESVAEEAMLETLRTLPLSILMAAAQHVWAAYADSLCWPFQPAIDGAYHLEEHVAGNSNSTAAGLRARNNVTDVIRDLPLANWLNGTHLRIPVLTGYNTNEGAIFIPPLADTNEEFLAFFTALIPTLSAADLAALEALYPDPTSSSSSSSSPSFEYKTPIPDGYGRQWARLDAAYAHYAYICPVLLTAHFLSSPPRRQAAGDRTSTPVYVYRFAARAGAWDTANHAAEAPVVAHAMDEVDAYPGLLAVADAMHGAWARFVTRGDPNPSSTSSPGGGGGGLAEWPVFESPFTNASAPALLRRLHEDEDQEDQEGDDSRAAAAGAKLLTNIGKLVLFGEGNDERVEDGAGRRRSPGTPAQVTVLSDREKAQCQFWFGIAALSEGMGRRLS